MKVTRTILIIGLAALVCNGCADDLRANVDGGTALSDDMEREDEGGEAADAADVAPTSDADQGTMTEDSGAPVDLSDEPDSSDCTPANITGSCSPLCQTECTGNQGCSLGSNGTPSCATLGTNGQGEPCSLADPCEEGLQCALESDTSTEGTCHQFCRPNAPTEAPTCPAGTACNFQLNADATLGMCLESCNTYPNDDCSNPDHMCYPLPLGNGCVPYKADASEGDSCMPLPGTCNKNQICYSGTCRRQCDLNSTDNCPPGRTCQSLGGFTFGACLP